MTPLNPLIDNRDTFCYPYINKVDVENPSKVLKDLWLGKHSKIFRELMGHSVLLDYTTGLTSHAGHIVNGKIVGYKKILRKRTSKYLCIKKQVL